MNLKEKFFDIFNMYVEKKSHQKKISKTLKKLYKKLKLKQLIFLLLPLESTQMNYRYQ